MESVDISAITGFLGLAGMVSQPDINAAVKVNATSNFIDYSLRITGIDGYSAVGVDAICKTTGMTKGAFYNAFGSKEHFLLTCLAYYADQNCIRIGKKLIAAGAKSPLQRLEKFYIDMLQVQSDIQYMGCMVNNMMSELGSSNELVGKATNQYFEHFLDALEPTIKEAQLACELTSAIESRQIATFYGILTRIKSSHDREQRILTMRLIIQTLKNK